MVKQFCSFSPCGKSFVYCGEDGKVKLWDTLSGILKQEFVPNLHLNQPCTSFVWLRFSYSIGASRKKKKRKYEAGKSSDSLGLGTNNGNIAVYNINESKIICTLQGGLSTSVSCLAWNKPKLLFSAADTTVAIWDLESKSLKSKWKCGKGKITFLDVSNDGEICVTGSYKLKIWNVKTTSLIKELTGHSSAVTSIRFIGDSTMFISTASDDRYISVWNLEDKQNDPVGRFVLGDAVQGTVDIIKEHDTIKLVAACRMGVLHYYSHQFNGSRSKAVKPVYRVDVASGSSIENGVGTTKSPSKSGSSISDSEVTRLPIVAVHLASEASATIAYGQAPSLTFETVEMKETKDSICLVRAPTVKKSENRVFKDDDTVVEEAEYIGGGIIAGGGKRLRDSNGKEVPLEERLNNLSTLDLAASSIEQDSTSSHSMAQLLSQALQSKDKTLLETVLFRKEISVVRQTVSKLPINLIPSLVRELSTMIQGKALTSSIAVIWLHCLLSLHSSQLLADDQSLLTLSGLHGLVETRLAVLPRLFRLSGRLDLLLQQVHGQSTPFETDQPALLVYQDEESSEDSSSLAGDGPEIPSESEDRWDELSDLDTEEMST